MDPTVPPFPAPKPRPGAWWFVLGGLLVIASLIVGVLLTLRIFDGFFSVEARIPADDQAHSVSVGTDGDRFLWVQEYGEADCAIRDVGLETEISVSPVSGSFTLSGGSGSWVAGGVFNPGSGQLSVTCASTAGPAEIGPALVVRDFVTGLLLAILVPLVLFGLGSVILVVTGILWAVRPSRT